MRFPTWQTKLVLASSFWLLLNYYGGGPGLLQFMPTGFSSQSQRRPLRVYSIAFPEDGDESQSWENAEEDDRQGREQVKDGAKYVRCRNNVLL